MKLLLVDDEPFVLRLLARQLNNLGFTDLTLCEKALDAAAILADKNKEVDVVFCDLQMPGMDGVELIRLMGKVGFSGSLVLVSGEDERILQTAENLARAHRLRVLGALHKPISSQQLGLLLHVKSRAAPAAEAPAKKIYGPDELREALAKGELVNYYQPKVLLADGSVAGVETLVRWRHPRDGLVMPDQFIPTAEAHRLIDDLTFVVLHAALQQAGRWHAARLPLTIAVNISMDNLTSLAFPEIVVQAANSAGVPLSSVVLEITESRLMQDRLAVMDILTRLRLKHIGLSIDDFGTGHSTLSQLRDLPFDELKVDRGFVHGAGDNASRHAILDASLAMARQLGMKTVAEGIEDRNDWDQLRACGCDLAQGYFIAKPMAAEDIPAWIREWEVRRSGLQSSVA